MKRKLPEKFFEQNQRAKTRKWKFFNLNQALWGAGNREFRNLHASSPFLLSAAPQISDIVMKKGPALRSPPRILQNLLA